MTEGAFLDYADACGATLARAHARTGDAATIAGYLGGGPCFDEAVADFAIRQELTQLKTNPQQAHNTEGLTRYNDIVIDEKEVGGCHNHLHREVRRP